jgi:vacuolar-type H+-ATPase subunit I/STV1
MALSHKYSNFLKTGLTLGLVLFLVVRVLAQDISPANEQDFVDAQNALESAQGVMAEKYSPESFKKSQDLLASANEARGKKDAVKFSQASRLARAYAELAKATAELKMEEERLSRDQEELQKVRAEIDQLKQGKTP